MHPRFLVSTTQHLLAVDPESHQLWRIDSERGLYFGLADGPDGLLYTACRNNLCGPYCNEERRGEKGSILVFDRSFRMVDELRPPFPLRDVHGIAVAHGRLWVTCSYDEMVAIFDLATRAWDRWYPAPGPPVPDTDVHHFNTIRFMNGKLYLVAHRFGPSLVLCYDFAALQLDSIVNLGCCAHDLFFLEDEMATCSSGEGWLVNRNGLRLRTGGFPRGLATTPDGNLLGLSMHAPREKRSTQDAVLRWYTADWRFKTDFLLPGVGMVLDILEMGEGFNYDRVEPWPLAEVTQGKYNHVIPGNLYLPGSFATKTARESLEWHSPEETHCWSASRNATITMLINPEETRLSVDVSSASPKPYCCEISLNEKHIGNVVFPAPGVQSVEFCIPSLSGGLATLKFRVPHLWRPADEIPGSTDDRLLGIAVHSVRLN